MFPPINQLSNMMAAAAIIAKQLLVGTRMGRAIDRVRWILYAPARARHPELWDLYLEDQRIELALTRLISDNDNCVDVGAHVGSKLAQIRKLAPNGSHVAFEPVGSKARSLQRRFQSVDIVQAATTDEIGSGRFYIDLTRPGFSGLTPPVGGSKVTTERVRLTRIDQELNDRDRIDFIKIDVEGAELPSLRGATETLGRHRPRILFECGIDAQVGRFGYERTDLYNFLRKKDYEIYSIVDFVYGRSPMTCQEFEDAGTYPYRGFNYVALPSGTPVEPIS